MYKIKVSKNNNSKLNKKKVILTILIIFVAIGLFIALNNVIRSIKSYNDYKQYEAQLQLIQQQEEEKKAKIEAEKERIRQERIPKLTQVRKG